ATARESVEKPRTTASGEPCSSSPPQASAINFNGRGSTMVLVLRQLFALGRSLQTVIINNQLWLQIGLHVQITGSAFSDVFENRTCCQPAVMAVLRLVHHNRYANFRIIRGKE